MALVGSHETPQTLWRWITVIFDSLGRKSIKLGYLQSKHGCWSCEGGQLSLFAALKRVGGAPADGRTGISAAGARIQDTGQREQEPDRPESHV